MIGRHGSRSRTGCSTCRTRKVKCDETRPVCARCQGARLPCEWLAVARRQQRRMASVSPDAAPTNSRRLLLPRCHSEATTIPASVALDRLPLPSSQELSREDYEYLQFFPHTLLVRVLGKSWEWCAMRYLHARVAPLSSATMTMILAISAGELEMIRYAQRSKPRLQHRADEGLGHLDVAYYRRALEEFGYVLRGLDYRSPISVDEILAVFFLMVVYEHQFGRQMSEMEAHLRGLYAFLATLFASNRDLTWTKLPSLSQQLLLFIMYINLNFSEPRYHGSLARLWHEAGHGMSFVSVMDQLFHGSRGGLRNMWMPAYPTEELIDDISVSRPLQFYHECNMLKGRLLLEAYSQSGAPQCQNAWQQELQKLEKRYQDLLEIGRRPDVNMRKHELQAIQFAVAEFHGLAVYTHELLCSDGCQHQGTWHHDTPDETLLVLHRVLRYDKEMAVRIQWPLLVIGKCKPPEVQELLLRESIGEVLGSRGRFQHMGSLYSCDAQRS